MSDSASDMAGAAARERLGVPLSELTTLRLGGPAHRLIEAAEDAQLIEAVASADAVGEPLLLIGGGSNLVIADAGFDGTVVHVGTRGVTAASETVTAGSARVRLSVAAGEPWDGVVAQAVAGGLAGIECLSGIPGSAGATPIQNVGAYGQQVSDTIVSVRVYDRIEHSVTELANHDCGFAYRSSRFRQGGDDTSGHDRGQRYLVLGVTCELQRSPLAVPIRYPALARTLGVEPGARAPLATVREAVLGLRLAKGMVLDPGDPDSVSAGSFFINPILAEADFAALERQVAQHLGPDVHPPSWPEGEAAVKTSAAWLIERAGFQRGYGTGRAGVSSKHTLAIVNRGGATTADVVGLAREIRDRVHELFAVELRPEPTLVGISL